MNREQVIVAAAGLVVFFGLLSVAYAFFQVIVP